MARKTPEERQRSARRLSKGCPDGSHNRRSQERAEAEAANHAAIITALAHQLAVAETVSSAPLDAVLMAWSTRPRTVAEGRPTRWRRYNRSAAPDRQYQRSG
jgi:hypothetical protein